MTPLQIAALAVMAVFYIGYFTKMFLQRRKGVLVFILAMATMKDSWRAGIPDEDKTELVTTGICRYCRKSAF